MDQKIKTASKHRGPWPRFSRMPVSLHLFQAICSPRGKTVLSYAMYFRALGDVLEINV